MDVSCEMVYILQNQRRTLKDKFNQKTKFHHYLFALLLVERSPVTTEADEDCFKTGKKTRNK